MPRLHSYDEKEVDFYHVDKNAQQIKPQDAATFPKLIQQLKQVTKNSKYPELYLVRGLHAWIAQNQAHRGREPDYNTPLFYARQLVDRRLPPANVYMQFCGYAGIECEEITGRAKAIRYRAGDADSGYLQNHSWIAFKADDKWHLMHPQWSIHAYVGYQHGGEIEIEKDGKDSVKEREEKLGQSQYLMNEFWFCTAPEIFVTRCLADDSKWQSPNDGKVFMPSVDQYISAPDLRQGFYNMKLSLMSQKSCILHSSKGKCFISILAEKDMISRLDFSYELVVEKKPGINLNVNDMHQLVLPQIDVRNRTFKFEVRLPVAGVYWFRLFVGFIDQDDQKVNCCGFKIICQEASENCQKFPTCKGLDMYGHGPKAVDAGLVSSSETNAKIKIEPAKKKKQTLAKFRTDEDSSRDMKYEAEILASSDSVDDSQIDIILPPDTTEVIHDKEKEEVVVMGTIEKKGEYAVVIKARDQKDKTQKKTEPVAGFLVTTEADVEDDKNNALMKKRQKEVRNEEKRQTKLDYINSLKEQISDLKQELKDAKVSGKSIGMDNNLRSF